MTRLKNLEEMYLERCHFITVINRTSFGSFCIYKYFMGFDDVLEWKQNKALGSQATPKASLCISKGYSPQGDTPFRNPDWESCYKLGFLKGTADRGDSCISIFWLLPVAVVNCLLTCISSCHSPFGTKSTLSLDRQQCIGSLYPCCHTCHSL